MEWPQTHTLPASAATGHVLETLSTAVTMPVTQTFPPVSGSVDVMVFVLISLPASMLYWAAPVVRFTSARRPEGGVVRLRNALEGLADAVRV